MKIRTGFVSNSSSSSFLVYVGKARDRKLMLGSTEYFLTYSEFYDMFNLASRNDWSSETDCRELVWSEVLEYYDPSRAWEPEAYERALVRAREIDKDQTDDSCDWLRLEISYHQPALLQMLRAMHEEGIVTVIYDEEERVIKNED